MNNQKQIFFLAIITLTLICACRSADTPTSFEHFITRSGAKLMDGDAEFRFISFNIPNILTVEDNLPFTENNPWRLPDKYEIEDALKTIKALGGNVARTYVITVRREGELDDIPRHVLAPGKFDETAFRILDQVLVSANEIGVRIIIPLMDNWKWMGGRPQYAAFRGKDTEEFWTDAQLREDFKQTIDYILNRKNTLTGTQYKDNKAILAWELGNELRDAPAAWVSEMAAYIKSIDKNHLVNDGIQYHHINADIIDDPNIDVLSTHHYERNPLDMLTNIRAAVEIIDGRKPYYIGEFGFISSSAMKDVLDGVIAENRISGALLWSLRFHNRDGGFYWHSEPLGRGVFKAYHFPGFTSGNEYDEKAVIKLMQQKTFEIKHRTVPPVAAPGSPVILPLGKFPRISWQGSVGAEFYRIERAEKTVGSWTAIETSFSDAAAAYDVGYTDTGAETDKSYYYRVTACNEAGMSAPSEVVGPVTFTHQVLIDELESYGKIYFIDGKAELVNHNARSFKEDFHRLAVKKGSTVIYSLSSSVTSWKINIFTRKKGKLAEVFLSNDGQTYQLVEQQETAIETGGEDYNYWIPVLLAGQAPAGNMNYLKVRFFNEAQIAKVEIFYGN
ncbi:MAG: cellulase family glycosylhydrolase [Candidatus Marinimicrobia bacterium]|nr:cellulase family glycosylhydrolase [Candidatus Neomarinimicrobiota bacterium]